MKRRKYQPTSQRASQSITKAVTNIRMEDVNQSKLVALDDLAQDYLSLCQQSITLFCTEEMPDKFRATCIAPSLSERWHRVAIQQAAGVAQSRRTNREQAYQDYLEELAEFETQRVEETLGEEAKEPNWNEWNVPTLRQTCIQANSNVVVLEPSHSSAFDFWLKLSTLEFRKLLLIPIKLAAYHLKAIDGKTINSSVTLNKRSDGWWLTLSYDEVAPIQTEPSSPVVGVDVGIANFLTTSTGKHYGTFNGKLRDRQKRVREKRRRKAKLRMCLEKKGVEKLPSTRSKSGQRLARHVRQEINRAVNQCFNDHPNAQFAHEQLTIVTMKYKSHAMNAYLYASNLAHIPEQLSWNAAKRGVAKRRVRSAYSSQERSMCHYADRANRPDQQTFCCVICGFKAHADLNAAINIKARWGDTELRACKDRREVKALLVRRHQEWRKKTVGRSPTARGVLSSTVEGES